MIQGSNSNVEDSCYTQLTNTPILQDLSFVRIDDHSETLLNGQYITMDMQSFEQQQQQQQQQQQYFDQQQQQAYCIENLHVYQQQQLPEQQFDSLYSGNFEVATPEEKASKETGIMDDRIVNGENSDASTTEGEINPEDEQYAYLRELNSDNLMQFSQQSVLQEMILKQHLGGKMNLNTLPIFEEHDVGNYNFKLNISPQHKKARTSWIYAEKENKLYIRMNDIFTINATYTPKMPIQQLRVRAFICFVKEVSEPVLRCQNHLTKDDETHNTKRESLLRCENPDAEYSGSSEGKNINERYSVSIPLSMCALQNDKTIKQPIALKFTCQNSCVGRKETCIMFLLEGMDGEILAQRLLNVRICSCPKRDRSLDEKNSAPKRKNNDDICQTDTKIRKNELSSPESPVIKDENSCSDYENAAKKFDIQQTANGGYRIVMEVSTKNNALSAIEFAYAKESVNIVDNPKDAALAKQSYHHLKKLYDTCKSLR